MNNVFDKENSKEWKDSSKSANNSTLSLHIAAYENFIEDSDALNGGQEGNKNDRLTLNGGISKQFLIDSASGIQNPFEFPRQQENQSSKPEVMQFKASQRLRNPNVSEQRHYISKLCDCGNQNVITHSPTKISIKRNYDPKGDFVPLESVLDDYTETSKSCTSIRCCVHGAPCKSGCRIRSSSRRSSNLSSSQSEYDYLDSGSDRKNSNGNANNLRPSCYYAKNLRSPTMTDKDKAYENIRIDQKSGPQFASHIVKTRWPLTELTADYPTLSLTSIHNNNNNCNNNQFQKDINPEIFYDFFGDHSLSSSCNNGDTLGRRKDKKKKCFNEKYPKLESVLEDTGYIELKVSTSKESFPRRSLSSKGGDTKSLGRRKDKKKKCHNH